MQPKKSEQPLGQLMADLSRDMLRLMRQEIEFAKLEMGQKAVEAAKCTVLIALGGGFAFAALLVLLFAVVEALAKVFTPFMAALIVSILVGNGGLVSMGIGFWKLRKENFAPRQTLELVREDVELIEEHVA